MMKKTLTVPRRKLRVVQTVPSAGVYTGTVQSLSIDEAESLYRIEWAFEDQNGTAWTLPQDASEEAMPDILIDLGLAGQRVDPVADAPGRQALIRVRTYGGRTSAKVTGTYPMPSPAI